MENLYYYTWSEEHKAIVPKFLEGGKNSHPDDIILGMEFYAPEKTFAEMSAKDYNAKLVKKIEDFDSAADDSIFIEVCKECGRAFAINKKEYLWFKDKGYNPPKRCKKCREARKAKKETEENKESK